MNNSNLHTAKIIYKIILYCFGFSILMIVLTRIVPIMDEIRDFAIGFPIIVAIFIAPAGLYYILKSYVRKEENKRQKLLYLFGMIFFNLIVISIVLAIVGDFRRNFF